MTPQERKALEKNRWTPDAAAQNNFAGFERAIESVFVFGLCFAIPGAKDGAPPTWAAAYFTFGQILDLCRSNGLEAARKSWMRFHKDCAGECCMASKHNADHAKRLASGAKPWTTENPLVQKSARKALERTAGFFCGALQKAGFQAQPDNARFVCESSLNTQCAAWAEIPLSRSSPSAGADAAAGALRACAPGIDVRLLPEPEKDPDALKSYLLGRNIELGIEACACESSNAPSLRL